MKQAAKLSKASVVLNSLFVLAIISILSVTVSAAAMSREQTLTLAKQSLSQKLKNDLVLKDVAVKFNKIQSYDAVSNTVEIKGEGTCRLDGEVNDLPVYFEVKIDTNSQKAANVGYVFLNVEGAVTTASTVTVEDVMTNELLNRLKNDLKTEAVVVAIDFVNQETANGGEKQIFGAGEVKLNGLIWKKIAFEARIGESADSISNLKYQLK